MRILFIGDVVGSPGRDTLIKYLPKLKEKYRPMLTIVNGENAAAGKELQKNLSEIFRNWCSCGYNGQSCLEKSECI